MRGDYAAPVVAFDRERGRRRAQWRLLWLVFVVGWLGGVLCGLVLAALT
jgi:hypothetical protein